METDLALVAARLTGTPRPWLILETPDWDAWREGLNTDPTARRIVQSLENSARKTLGEPPPRGGTSRHLSASRLVLRRVLALTITYRLTGGGPLLRRAEEELLAAAHFSHWGPVAIDLAEMALAVALGYDWLHDALSPSAKRQIESALLEMAIRPTLAGPDPGEWMGKTSNQNQVSHAGLAAAALAVADQHPSECTFVLQRAVRAVSRMAVEYAPDGAYSEGVMYWDYGTSFHAILCDLLLRASGSAQGLDCLPGFAQSADYAVQMLGPSGHSYCYADCLEKRSLLPSLFWFAAHYRRPELLQFEVPVLPTLLDRSDAGLDDVLSEEFLRLLGLVFVWWHRRDQTKEKASPFPRSWLGRGAMPVAVHRSAFGPPDAVFIAIKGGSAKTNHAHMDAGSFLMEAGGVRWALDPGMQHYHTLEPCGVDLWNHAPKGQRWQVLRIGPEGHNILRLNEQPQSVEGRADFVLHHAEPEGGGYSVLDLTQIYAGQFSDVRRGICLCPDGAVVVRDEWTMGNQDGVVSWQMLTRAGIDWRADGAHLHQDGRTLQLAVAAPRNGWQGTARALDELARPHDEANPGLQRLVLRQFCRAGQHSAFSVSLLSGSHGEMSYSAAEESLDNWASLFSKQQL